MFDRAKLRGYIAGNHSGIPRTILYGVRSNELLKFVNAVHVGIAFYVGPHGRKCLVCNPTQQEVSTFSSFRRAYCLHSSSKYRDAQVIGDSMTPSSETKLDTVNFLILVFLRRSV
jgi:hypothetical protein